MVRKYVLVALGGLMIAGCGAPGAGTAGGIQMQAGTTAADQKLDAEAYNMINRWALDRNYMVTSVQAYQAGGGRAPKSAVRGIFWATYRTKKGFLFKDGYWNVYLRDESDPSAMGSGRNGRGRYDQNYGPSYNHYSGNSMMYEGFEDIDETEYDDYDEDYTYDCDGTTSNYGGFGGSTYGSGSQYGGFGAPGFGTSGRRRNPRSGYNDGLDCYPGSNTGTMPGYGSPGYGDDYGSPGYGSGQPYRSPYNSYRGPQVTVAKVQDNWKSKNFKMFNGERAIAFIDGQKIKEVRLMRDGSTIWKTVF